MAVYKKEGKKMKVTLSATVAAHTPILVGNKVVVTSIDGVADDEVECDAEGVFEFDADGAIAQGDFVTFDNTTKTFAKAAEAVVSTSIADPIHGVAWTAAADNKVWVKIN